MGKIRNFKIEETEYIARELTVKQIRETLDELESGEYETDMIDLLFPDRVPSTVVSKSLGMSPEELAAKDFPPAVVEKIISEVEEVNPFFAGLIQRLAKIGREALTLSTDRSAG